MNKIYQVVDMTDDEMYFSMGFFYTKDDAVKAIKEATDKTRPLSDHADEYEKIEIREQEIGLSDDYKTVYELERRSEYDEETDEYVWE